MIKELKRPRVIDFKGVNFSISEDYTDLLKYSKAQDKHIDQLESKLKAVEENKLFEKLKIAFKYGIKATESHPDNDDCDDSYFDKAITVINRVYTKNELKNQ